MKLATAILFVSALRLTAQIPSLAESGAAQVAPGVTVRHLGPASACGLGLPFPPPSPPGPAPVGGKGLRAAAFAEFAAEQFRSAPAAAARDAGESPSWQFELQLTSFREASRWRNIVATLGGAMANDPGHYTLAFAVGDPRSNSPAAIYELESTPTVLGLLLANPWSRQGAIRKNVRRQMRAVHAHWRGSQASCSAAASSAAVD